MNKYVTPTIEFEDVCVSDVIAASGVQIAALKGVDNEGEKSAVFNAGHWFTY